MDAAPRETGSIPKGIESRCRQGHTARQQASVASQKELKVQLVEKQEDPPQGGSIPKGIESHAWQVHQVFTVRG